MIRDLLSIVSRFCANKRSMNVLTVLPVPKPSIHPSEHFDVSISIAFIEATIFAFVWDTAITI
ncbi:MAG TPA: hypothetical protein ENF93_02315 [Ignisphaera sp.]|nr:hypothetical protein [Ignisphaera sp.]